MIAYLATHLPTRLTFVAELTRKGSRKIVYSAMPATGRGGDEIVAPRRVPLEIRRSAKAVLIPALALAATLLAGAAQADSIKGQENAEIVYCKVETDTMSGRTTKDAIDRRNACLKSHGWLPGSGEAKILQRRYIAQANAAIAEGEAMADAVIGALARCRAISGTDVPASSMSFMEYARRSEIYAACRTAAGL